MYDINKFCARLKKARKNAGLTQQQLGKELGILQTAYSRFERGKYQFNYEQLCYIAKRLDISVDYLMGITDDE